ncbi:hypothetical protein ACFXAZ_11500 [Streptomyces sp. NPDC059477]|uniref:hypothetical protein n=1 Tax=Streptomyces sp. NPDC059477 TaxID=3346847 RepID=UPI0036AA58C3
MSDLYDLAVEIWTDPPARTTVETVVRRYFSLLRAGRIPEAVQLVDHTPVRHVLQRLWVGSVGASVEADDADDADDRLAADQWERDLSWLGELTLGDFHWGHTGSSFYVEITYNARTIEVSLGFWVKPTDTGWVVSGPSTLW